jgi:hypothetical protein
MKKQLFLVLFVPSLILAQEGGEATAGPFEKSFAEEETTTMLELGKPTPPGTTHPTPYQESKLEGDLRNINAQATDLFINKGQRDEVLKFLSTILQALEHEDKTFELIGSKIADLQKNKTLDEYQKLKELVKGLKISESISDRAQEYINSIVLLTKHAAGLSTTAIGEPPRAVTTILPRKTFGYQVPGVRATTTTTRRR